MEKNCLCCIWKVHKSKITEVDELKHYQIKSNHEELISFSKIKKIYLTTLTPSRACLEEHINLANYQVRSTYLETRLIWPTIRYQVHIWKLANVIFTGYQSRGLKKSLTRISILFWVKRGWYFELILRKMKRIVLTDITKNWSINYIQFYLEGVSISGPVLVWIKQTIFIIFFVELCYIRSQEY